MVASENCFRLIQKSEGCELQAYLCPAGVPTIGYGHTQGVRLGMRCTPAQAAAWLCEDIHSVEQAIAKHVPVPLNQDQFDALASLVFNLGPGMLATSTLAKLLQAGDYSGAANEFPKWCHAGGKVLSGLETRRKRERALFLGNPDFMEVIA